MTARVGAGWLFALALHIHLHRFHGPPLDYATLAVGAFASWVGLPGPGEPLLIAAGVLSAQNKLDLPEVLVVAFAASVAGGIVGWLIGVKAGRALILWRGPLLSIRQRALERGDEVFGRYPAMAVLMTMSWIAGIHRVRPSVYLLWNAVGAAIWTLGIALGAYFAGPPVVDVVNDVGLLPVIGVVGLVAVGLALEFGWRRRRKQALSG